MLEGLRAVSPMLLAHNRVRDLAACSLVYCLGTCPSTHSCWAEFSPALRFGAQHQQQNCGSSLGSLSWPLCDAWACSCPLKSRGGLQRQVVSFWVATLTEIHSSIENVKMSALVFCALSIRGGIPWLRLFWFYFHSKSHLVVMFLLEFVIFLFLFMNLIRSMFLCIYIIF